MIRTVADPEKTYLKLSHQLISLRSYEVQPVFPEKNDTHFRYDDETQLLYPFLLIPAIWLEYSKQDWKRYIIPAHSERKLNNKKNEEKRTA